MAAERGSGAFIAPDAQLGTEVEVDPGAVIQAGARIGSGVWIGSRAVIRAGTEIGEDCVVEEGAVLGKRPRLRPGSSAAGEERGPLVVEA
ncbi:MAG: DapH/DapD/GlmU-related protein, partial [Solirubrobacteraceae bacterium]